MDKLPNDWMTIASEICELFIRKQNDYGPRNIEDLGEKGVFVRLYDKMQRLRQLTWKDTVPKVMNETIEDTLKDIADYAIIWLLLRRGLWSTQ